MDKIIIEGTTIPEEHKDYISSDASTHEKLILKLIKEGKVVKNEAGTYDIVEAEEVKEEEVKVEVKKKKKKEKEIEKDSEENKAEEEV